MPRAIFKIIIFLFLGIHASGQLVINEIVASNKSFEIFHGTTPDLIEIYNTGDEAIQMKGYCLSNNPDNITLWSFPDTCFIQPKGFLLIFADENNTLGGFHTNFKLKAKGGYIALTNKISGNIIDSFEYNEQQSDISYGCFPDGSNNLKYMDEISPGQSNHNGLQQQLLQPEFSHTRGFYKSPIDLTIYSQDLNGTIVYTLDGSEPLNEISGATKRYNAPLPINTTTCIRVKLIKEGSLSSNIVTHSFIFLSDVIKQPANPEGFPSNWAHTGKGDYEMDPEVVNDPIYSNQIIAIFKSIPTVSLVMNKDDLFGTEGIYLKGENIEKAVSTEYMDRNDSHDFQVNCGLTVFGGTSTIRWKSDKLSMRLKFKTMYGASKLKVPLFGENNPTEFNTVVLDAGSNNCWHYGGERRITRYPFNQRAIAQYTRDQFTADLQNAIGGYAQHGFYVHLYLNGLYWGIYNLHERPDEEFAASYLGGKPEDYDVIKHSVNGVVNGSNEHYLKLYELADRVDEVDSAYTEIENILDIDGFIDYIILNYYLGNTDWAIQNWYATYNREVPDGKWRFHSWDAEHIMESKSTNVVKDFDELTPTHLHHLLIKNDKYKQRFADEAQRLMYSNGVLSPEVIGSYYQNRISNVEDAIVTESARWGDNQRNKPYTKEDEWETERYWVYNSFFPNRRDYVIEQFRDMGWIPAIDAPVVKLNNKVLNSTYYFNGDELQLRASKGAIYYTNDGTDPKNSDSEVAANAIRYKTSLLLDQQVNLIARAYYKGDWSARIVVQLEEHKGIIIDEIYYHAKEEDDYIKDDLEFVTLKNTSNEPINLSGAAFTKGISYNFTEGSILYPDSCFTLASNESIYEQFYGKPVLGEFVGRLNIAGEQILLSDIDSNVITDVTYSNLYPWPVKPDGSGYALKYKAHVLNSNMSDPINWSIKAIQAKIIDQPSNLNGKSISMIVYPNPAIKEVNLVYYLFHDQQIMLSLYNMQGQQISIPVNKLQKAGQYNIAINIQEKNIPSGIYIACIKTHNEIVTKKFVVFE